MIRGVVVGAVCVGLLTAAGCGSESAPAGDETTTSAPDCPVTVDELASATSLAWQAETVRRDHPLETVESVEVTACIFTSPEKQGMGGDPLVLRVDVVDPEDAGTVRDAFTTSCTEFGGTVSDADSGTVCTRNGAVVEGYVGDLVTVHLVNADQPTAAALTPSFESLLAAAT